MTWQLIFEAWNWTEMVVLRTKCGSRKIDRRTKPVTPLTPARRGGVWAEDVPESSERLMCCAWAFWATIGCCCFACRNGIDSERRGVLRRVVSAKKSLSADFRPKVHLSVYTLSISNGEFLMINHQRRGSRVTAADSQKSAPRRRCVPT